MKKLFASISVILILLVSVTALFSWAESYLPVGDEVVESPRGESDLLIAGDPLGETDGGETARQEGETAQAGSGSDPGDPPLLEPNGEHSQEPNTNTEPNVEQAPSPDPDTNSDPNPEPKTEPTPEPDQGHNYQYVAPASDYEHYLAACAAANVNVRRGAGTDYGVLFTLGIGDSLPYLWREGEWIAVWTGERVGYLSAAYAYLSETNLAIERTIRAGLKKLGTPYEWGATRRITGSGVVNPFFTGKSFDCSSFVQYCYYIGMGIKLGNYTGSQADYTVGEKITRYEDLQRGDFYFTGTDGTISHVVIYLGGGKLLQAYSANGGPVSVTADERWKRNFISGRRPDPTVVTQYK